jgi:hypothetical protein
MSITWTLTAGGLVIEAAQRIQMLGQGQNLSAHQLARGLAHLNALLKLLQTQGPSQWRRASQTVDLVQAQASYTLSPRPDRVRDAFYQEENGRELVMGRWNYDDYEMLPTKTQQGRPVVYTIDRQRANTAIVVWPTPDATSAARTIRVSYDRVMEDVTDTASEIDVPQEWLDTVADTVGGRLAVDFRIENPSAQEVKQRAQASLAELLGSDREESITFVLGGIR